VAFNDEVKVIPPEKKIPAKEDELEEEGKPLRDPSHPEGGSRQQKRKEKRKQQRQRKKFQRGRSAESNESRPEEKAKPGERRQWRSPTPHPSTRRVSVQQ